MFTSVAQGGVFQSLRLQRLQAKIVTNCCGAHRKASSKPPYSSYLLIFSKPYISFWDPTGSFRRHPKRKITRNRGLRDPRYPRPPGYAEALLARWFGGGAGHSSASTTASRGCPKPYVDLGAEYPSPKKVNLSIMVGFYKPKKVKGYLQRTLSLIIRGATSVETSSMRFGGLSQHRLVDQTSTS